MLGDFLGSFDFSGLANLDLSNFAGFNAAGEPIVRNQDTVVEFETSLTDGAILAPIELTPEVQKPVSANVGTQPIKVDLPPIGPPVFTPSIIAEQSQQFIAQNNISETGQAAEVLTQDAIVQSFDTQTSGAFTINSLQMTERGELTNIDIGLIAAGGFSIAMLGLIALIRS